MKWKRIPLGSLRTNCYLYIKEEKCLVIDPGADSARLIRYLKEKQLTPIAILLTHGHFDHIGAVDDLREKYGIPCYIHQGDSRCLTDSRFNLGDEWLPEPLVLRKADVLLDKDSTITIGEFKLEFFHTPGHSEGSSCFYDVETRILFAGDTLFRRSIGRTDLITSDEASIYESIFEKIFKLPDDTLVLPGHGAETILIDEKTTNPYLLSKKGKR